MSSGGLGTESRSERGCPREALLRDAVIMDCDGRRAIVMTGTKKARGGGDGAGSGGEERKRAVHRYSNVLATMPRIIKRRESKSASSLVAIRIRSCMMPRRRRHRWWWPDGECPISPIVQMMREAEPHEALRGMSRAERNQTKGRSKILPPRPWGEVVRGGRDSAWGGGCRKRREGVARPEFPAQDRATISPWGLVSARGCG